MADMLAHLHELRKLLARMEPGHPGYVTIEGRIEEAKRALRAARGCGGCAECLRETR